jgi:hypothetical protein
MFTNTSFDALANTLKENAAKFNPAASQEAFKPMMDNLKAWGQLAQQQAQTAQAAMAETLKSFKGIQEPQAAFEVMKASAEQGLALASQNAKDVMALSFEQFHSSVDALHTSHPASEAFAPMAKGLKNSASAMQNVLESTMKHGAAAVQKARA